MLGKCGLSMINSRLILWLWLLTEENNRGNLSLWLWTSGFLYGSANKDFFIEGWNLRSRGSLQTGGVNRQFPGGLSGRNCSSVSVYRHADWKIATFLPASIVFPGFMPFSLSSKTTEERFILNFNVDLWIVNKIKGVNCSHILFSLTCFRHDECAETSPSLSFYTP